jgi:hypothetical protein
MLPRRISMKCVLCGKTSIGIERFTISPEARKMLDKQFLGMNHGEALATDWNQARESSSAVLSSIAKPNQANECLRARFCPTLP